MEADRGKENAPDGMAADSLYYRMYYLLRRPLIDMMLEGVAWDSKEARKASKEQKARKEEIRLDLDRLAGVPLYSTRRHRSKRLLSLLEEQKAQKEIRKAAGPRTEEGKKIGGLLKETQKRLRELRASGGHVECEIGKGLSSLKIGSFLYDRLCLPAAWRRRKDSGKTTRTTDDVALQRLALSYPEHEELLRKIREFRRCEKLIFTYLNADRLLSPLDGRLHSQYKTFGTQTGRLSSSADPWGFGGNAQNLDRSYRWLVLPT